jgi:O-antigen/teichoic acid export membrane protein
MRSSHLTRKARVHLGSGALVLAGLVVWNAGNYVFFLIAGRMLGESDYGLLAALLAATLVVFVPCGGLQVALARLVASNGAAAAARVYRRAFLRCAMASALLSAAVIVVVVAVPDAPHGALVLTVLVACPMALFSLAIGQLQGESRFGAFATSLALLGAPRPIALAVFGAIGWGVGGALGASVVAMAAATFVAVWFTRSRLAGRQVVVAEHWRTFSQSLVPLVAGLSGIGILLNLDIIVAKLALTDEVAGEFAAVAILGKAATLLPQALAWILLPSVASSTGSGVRSEGKLAAAAGLTIVTGGVVALACVPLGSSIMRTAFGTDFAEGGPYLASLVAASSILGLVMLLMNHHVARGKVAFGWLPLILAALLVPAFALFHGSAAQIIAVDFVVVSLGVLAFEVFAFRGRDGITAGVVGARHGRSHD